MEFDKEKVKKLIKNADSPLTQAEKTKYDSAYLEMIDNILKKIGNSYSQKDKQTAKSNFVNMGKSCKTKLQYLHTFLQIISRVKSIPSLQNDIEPMLEKIAELFGTHKEKLKDIYKYTSGMQISAGQLSIQEDHKIAMSSLLSLATLLNENKINYNICGALPCYLLAEGELLRYHDDIDIVVDDKDIPKIVELVKKSDKFKDYSVTDDRLKSNSILEGFDKEGKPICEDENPHQVLFQHKKSEFHIGFFQYDQKKNGTREMKTYYTDKKTKKPVVYHSFSLTPEEWEKEYGETIVLKDEKGKVVPVPCSTVKSVYDKKLSERAKDKFDRSLLSDYVLEHTDVDSY